MHCSACDLWFVPPRYFLSAHAETARYDLHTNRLDNPGYCAYLKPVVESVVSLCAEKPDPCVLDFGAGKHAVVSHLLAQRGISVVAFDPLYGLGLDYHLKTYDVILVHEVLEHIKNVRETLILLGRLLRKGGNMLIRTQLTPKAVPLALWWYAQDPTHIRLFSKQSLHIAAEIAGCEIFCTKESEGIVFRRI